MKNQNWFFFQLKLRNFEKEILYQCFAESKKTCAKKKAKINRPQYVVITLGGYSTETSDNLRSKLPPGRSTYKPVASRTGLRRRCKCHYTYVSPRSPNFPHRIHYYFQPPNKDVANKHFGWAQRISNFLSMLFGNVSP